MVHDPGSSDAPDATAEAPPGRRIVVYGAESGIGRAVVAGLRAAGASLGLTSATSDGAALFALKRTAAGDPTQAVDLGNVTNVRVATRKLAKELGGVDAAVVIPGAVLPGTALQDVLAIAAREISRSGRGPRSDPGHGRVLVIADVLQADTALQAPGVVLDVIAPRAVPQRLAGLLRTLVGGELGGGLPAP